MEYLEQEVLEELNEEYGQFISRPDIGLSDALKKFLPSPEKVYLSD